MIFIWACRFASSCNDEITKFEEVIMNQAIFNLLPGKAITLLQSKYKRTRQSAVNNLSEADIDKEYIINNVIADDKAMVNFLFTLGCFKGESVTVISVLSENFVISIKDARYSIDADLAKAIILN